jgi:hypothetical protein
MAVEAELLLRRTDPFTKECAMERFLLLWDDLDDWLALAVLLISRRKP